MTPPARKRRGGSAQGTAPRRAPPSRQTGTPNPELPGQATLLRNGAVRSDEVASAGVNASPDPFGATVCEARGRPFGLA